MCGSNDRYRAVPVPGCERSPNERDGTVWGVGVDHIVVLHGLPTLLHRRNLVATDVSVHLAKEEDPEAP